MKSHRPILLLAIVVVMSLSAVTFAKSVAHSVTGSILRSVVQSAVQSVAQSDMHKAADKPVVSDAQKSFDTLKALAGTWQGSVTMSPPNADIDGTKIEVTLRVTSRGNALVHEMQEAGKPLDATKYDHPVTMLYLNEDRLYLIHYCDAGNRPRMVARTSPDGKTVEFDFQDLSGGNEYGHMYHAVFTTIDANHHTEDWTYMEPGDKPAHAHMDLKRGQ